MKKIAVYPGTFDPVTNGHLDIVERATQYFEEVIWAVAEQNNKTTLFTMQERIDLIKDIAKHLPNVKVVGFDGLLVDFCQRSQAGVVIRGLRAMSDFEKEFQMALMNKEMNQQVETMFLMTAANYQFVSSSIIKNVASMGGQISRLVPPIVEEALQKKYGYK